MARAAALTDGRGNAVSTASPEALAAGEQALWRMMSFYGTPLDDLDAAIAADPRWALPHAMKAGFLLSLTEPSLAADARAHLAAARVLGAHANAREQAHIGALVALGDGDWALAAGRWREVAARHPRDALALQWGHLLDFYRGDAASLEARIAAALPAWRDDDAWRPFIVAMHAFGLEESGRYDEAEAIGRAALGADPRVPWAIHAVAHVMEMQGRHDEGARWMAERGDAWGEGNGFSGHLGWHEALFALEAMDIERALAVFDLYLGPAAIEITLQRVDAASLLWRIALHGGDVRARFRALVDGWPLDAGRDPGRSAFNDLHVVLALIGAGDLDPARRWIAAARRGAETGGEWNRRVMRESGDAVLAGVLAFGEGRWDDAAHALGAAAAHAAQLGGSHAQRDVLEQTQLAAAAHGSLHGAARALAAARLARKATPLTEWWLALLGGPPG